MTDAIKSVTVDVSVKTSMAAAVDGLKAIDVAAAGASDRMKQLEERVAALNRSMSSIGASQINGLQADRASVRGLQGNLSDIFGVDVQDDGSRDVPDWVYGAASGGPRRSRGSGRSGGDPFALTAQERAMTRSAGRIQRDREKEREEYERQFHKEKADKDAFRQNILDNDIANAVRATNEGKKEQAAEAKAAASALKNLATHANATSTSFQHIAQGVARGASMAGVHVPGGPSHIAALANPATLVATLAAGTALLARQMNIWRTAESKMLADFAARGPAIRSEFADMAVGAHAEQAIRLSNATPNIGAIRQIGINLTRHGQTEIAIRERQIQSGRAFEGREEIRQRMERERQAQERVDQSKIDVQHAREQSVGLAGARLRFDSDVATSARAFAEKRRGILGTMRQSTGLSRTWAGITGQESDVSVAAHNAGVLTQVAKADADRQQEINRQKEEGNKLSQQAVDLAHKELDATGKVVSATREKVAVARQDMERDRATIESANRHAGGLNEGDLHILRQLEAKRKTGATPEQWEIERGRSLFAPGSKGLRWIEQAEERRGAGVQEMDVDIQKSTKRFEELEKSQRKDEPELMKSVEEQSKRLEQMSRELIQAIKEAFNTQELSRVLMEAFENAKKDNEEMVRKLVKVLI